MKRLVILVPVLLVLIAESDCGVVDRVYDGAAEAVDTTKEAIGGIFSFGKDLVFGKNDPNPETGRHSDGIVGGVMNTIHTGAGYIRNGVSKVMDYEQSLRQKVVGVFKHNSDKGTEGVQGAHDTQSSQDNKQNEPVYHHGEGLLDVRMLDNVNHSFTRSLNNTRDYVNSVNNDIYDKVDDGYKNFKDNVNEFSNNAIDNVRKATDNANENFRGVEDQFNKNMDNFKDNAKNQFDNIENNFKNTMEKENEMLYTRKPDSIVFGDIVRDKRR
ncbi:hypothetical protein K1T71_004187 [Dendrolimus kikuchii]|uniref:Uncharacterized protein n=1 Tax=Dendrolimus kikuchii TaxID=765133 RepID=A0ACC1DA29_9NEOP|nr:hypothetical protein K1T71_004187 [Dendrolimus kikuchii]